MRLRDRIKARAAGKFSDVELEGNPPSVILCAIDFRVPVRGADGADCCTETGGGIKRFEISR